MTARVAVSPGTAPKMMPTNTPMTMKTRVIGSARTLIVP